MDLKQTREHALEMYKEAVEAANPKKCVLDHVRLMGSTLMVDSAKYDLDEHESIYVIAFGKAASSMAEATTGGRVLGRVVAYATGLRADRRQVAWGTYHGNSHNTGVGAEPPAPTPDTTPPQVAILRPASGGKVFVLARIELEVRDDVLVERVELQVDGVAVATLSEAPFAFDWRPGAREPGPARIRAVAYDPAGNQASAEVEVEVTRLVREVEPTQRAPVRNPKRTPSPMKQPLGGG